MTSLGFTSFGRLQIKLLDELQYLGVYLYSCVPNTTAVTQDMDRTYGRFKSQYRANLKMLIDKLVRQDETLSMPQHKHGLLIFGGIDPKTKLELPLASELGFSCEPGDWCRTPHPPMSQQAAG
jgi:hypothetical protein